MSHAEALLPREPTAQSQAVLSHCLFAAIRWPLTRTRAALAYQGCPLRLPHRRGNRRTSCHAPVGVGDCPPSCQPIPGHCRGRQSGHFLEIGSLHPPPTALRRFPRRPVCQCFLLRTRRGDPRGRPRAGQSPAPTHYKKTPLTPCKTPCHCEPVTDVTGVAIRIPLHCPTTHRNNAPNPPIHHQVDRAPAGARSTCFQLPLYFLRVAIPPRICRCALFSSRIAFTCR